MCFSVHGICMHVYVQLYILKFQRRRERDEERERGGER